MGVARAVRVRRVLAARSRAHAAPAEGDDIAESVVAESLRLRRAAVAPPGGGATAG
ncbi:hypothetical protein RM780_26605 [Streptomyces sp. DSM 44917]|uniref:Uncharacterized protein n=1 Tax=Streptomyces boetiae TaxID=3075541 RepID=A0ABU2LGW2_9ACTN|nr:hypothetical protein [Streptomyces sp. DSM 44917]MDT0310492.1 hypothetical protein [Streptomyces sp. DSM 44917]